MRRDLAFGVGVSAAVLWLTFFATPGTVVAATLLLAVVALIWFATVDPARLHDDRGRPNLMLFGLTAVAGALVVTATVFISTPTVFLVGTVVLAAIVVGLTRALRAAMNGA
ncbi:MAG TPA: hypothetical protein VLB67_02655 [Acidimicrobiia bacterium]|nr:hypothetical protein [Acidimicrobiia bacterium]